MADTAIAAVGITTGLTFEALLAKATALAAFILLCIRIWLAIRNRDKKKDDE